MNWVKRLNNALRYIDGHLTERLDSRTIASKANTSSFHFQKMFYILSDMNLAEYIRSRRLKLAAREIVDGAGILDMAIQYGYETQASFTRAFKPLHGFAPGMARDPGVVIKAYPPLSFQRTVPGGSPMANGFRQPPIFMMTGRSLNTPSEEAMENGSGFGFRLKKSTEPVIRHGNTKEE